MTKGEALQNFFNGFGIDAYAGTSVPDDVIFPWLTYDLITGAWSEEEVGITVNLWYHTTSEATPNAKANEIAQAIGLGGVTIPCDEGLIWLKRGEPWCQALGDDNDPMIKRRYINVSAEFLTLY